MLIDIIKNLWYSFVSRKIWERNNIDGFGYTVGYEFLLTGYRSIGFPMVMTICFVITAQAYNLSNFSLLDYVIISMPVIEIYIYLDSLIEKSKPTALYYVKMKLKIIQQKQNSSHNIEKSVKKISYPFGQGVGNINIHNIRSCFFDSSKNNGENSLTIGTVADKENILNSAGKANKGKGVQKNIVAVIKNGGTDQVQKNAGGKDGGLFKAAGRMEAPTLETTLASDKEELSNNDCNACNLEYGKRNLILIAKCYLSARLVKGGKGNGLPEFVDNSCNWDRKKCAQDKIYDILGIIQDKHLWAEHNRFNRMMIYSTSPLWVPIALISGGFRVADRYNANKGWLRDFFEKSIFFPSWVQSVY